MKLVVLMLLYLTLILSCKVNDDTIGVKIFQGKRKEYFGEDRPIAPEPKHIRVADVKYGLGNSSMDKINLIKIGYDEESFI